jgi:hypothetical protein
MMGFASAQPILRRYRFSIQFSNSNEVARLRDLAAPRARVFARISRTPFVKRAQGMPDAKCTRSLACKIKQSIRVSSPQVHRKSVRHSLRDGVNSSSVVALVYRACKPPSPAGIASQTGHQRRGARPPRLCRPQASPFVKGAARVHRLPPRVRHVRVTPLSSGQDNYCFRVICGF